MELSTQLNHSNEKRLIAEAGGKAFAAGIPRNFKITKNMFFYSDSGIKRMRHNTVDKLAKGGKKKVEQDVEMKVVSDRLHKNYCGQEVFKRRKRSVKPNLCKLKKSLTPGTVCILLAGNHRGKRVVFLKQMKESGLILICGPRTFNGVPLRRISQKFVIATSVKLDVSNMSSNIENLMDVHFKRVYPKVSDDPMERTNKMFTLSEDYSKAQNEISKGIVKNIKAREDAQVFKKYLKTRFGLQRGQYPHLMKF